ncbi:ABC transporter permease [Bifidobacterium tibiigranuli]|uniref:ABC transporter permease n=1 Tax=Bifidobacterium tibiigranuli TaxID=2172043 RepID=UPI00235529B5|nr:ABC transporter permease [Bifidobacterium tibiigranuli]MCI1210623.1 ABC transporter permease [Bifidobacterium tibiigranuli]MCI1220819.1 ABC transporter permease [Bifidobacterium tibiigranuli]
MSTFNTAMRIVWRHKSYLLIYLVGLSVMMVAMLLGTVGGGARTADGTPSYAPRRAQVAVVDRDGNRGGVAQGLREYLSASADLIDVDDTTQSLQDAVTTNRVDYVLIIPNGYVCNFADKAAQGEAIEPLDTVTSYTSAVGAMANMRVQGFFASLRTAYLAQIAGANGVVAGDIATANAPAAVTDMAKAVAQVVRTAKGPQARTQVKVVQAEGEASRYAKRVYASGLKFGGYPIVASMIMVISLVVGIFGLPETRRRASASPLKPLESSVSLLSACAVVGIGTALYYLALCLGPVGYLGGDLAAIGAGPVLMGAGTMLAYIVVAISIGFVLGQFGVSEGSANGFANIVGLIIVFTSGIWFDPSMMPATLIAIGKMLPGWWYADAIDRALGTGAYLGEAANVAGWASSTALMLLFAFALLCIGLAVGAVRRRRPGAMAAGVTVLSSVV